MISFNPEEARWDIKEVESAGAVETEGKTGPEHWPKMAQDSTHEHPLKLKKAVYNGIYRFEPRPPRLRCTNRFSRHQLTCQCAVLATSYVQVQQVHASGHGLGLPLQALRV